MAYNWTYGTDGENSSPKFMELVKDLANFIKGKNLVGEHQIEALAFVIAAYLAHQKKLAPANLAGTKDWTADEFRSNSSNAFFNVTAAIEGVLWQNFDLFSTDQSFLASKILADLVQKHGFIPT